MGLTVLLLSIFVRFVHVDGVDCTFATSTNVLNISEDCTMKRIGDNYTRFQTNSPVFFIHGTPLWLPQKILTINDDRLRHFKVSNDTELVLVNLELVGGEINTKPNVNKGGAVLVEENSRLTAKKVNFVGNTAQRGGFAVYLKQNAIFNCTDCVFSGNKWRSKASTNNDLFGTIGGGEIGGLYLRNCHFIDNVAWNEQGGAIGVKLYRLGSGQGPRDNEGVVLENCIFQNNRARIGGAVYFGHASKAIVKNCTFFNNNATSGDGGGIFIDNGVSHGSPFRIEKSLFESNSALEGNGGAIAMTRTSLILNLSPEGPKSEIKYEPMLVNDCRFDKNVANSSGGALFMKVPNYDKFEPGQAVELNNSVFKSNFAMGSNGGGAVRMSRENKNAGLELKILHSRLESNAAVGGSGGSVSLACAAGEFRFSEFLNNRAGEDGGSEIDVQDSELLIYESTLTSINNEGGYEVIKSDKEFTLVDVHLLPLLGWKNYSMVAKCSSKTRLPCTTFGDYSQCVDNTVEIFDSVGVRCGCPSPGCSVQLRPDFPKSINLTGSVDHSSILGPYNLKEGADGIRYSLQLSSPPEEPVKVCADITSTPRASSLKINVLPRCVNFITGTENVVITVNSTDDRIDALVDHQDFVIIHYVVKNESDFFYAALADNVTVVVRVLDENEAGVTTSGDLTISSIESSDFLLLELRSKPLFPVIVDCTVEHADVYRLDVVDETYVGYSSHQGLRYIVYNDTAWWNPMKIKVHLRPDVLPPLSAKLTVEFQSDGDSKYNNLPNITKQIKWESSPPEVEHVSVDRHDATLVKIRWTAPGTRWSNDSRFVLKLQTIKLNEETDTETVTTIWTEPITVRLKAPLYMVQPSLRMKYDDKNGKWGLKYDWKNVKMASECKKDFYLDVSSSNPNNWKCQDCPIDKIPGDSQFNCEGCRTWEDVALRKGFWRPDKNHTWFYPCLSSRACLGEQPEEDFNLARYEENVFEWSFLQKYSSCFSAARTINNLSVSITRKETCNETAGHKQLCHVGGKKRRCRLCATCMEGYVRSGSKCNKCNIAGSIAYFIGCLLMFCICFAAMIRLRAKSRNRKFLKSRSSTERNILLSYFQVHMIIRGIPIQWPKAMDYVVEAHAALSGAGLSETSHIDCLFGSAMASSEVLYTKQLTLLITFTVLGIATALSVRFRICRPKVGQVGRRKGLDCEDHFVVAFSYLLYMFYPSLTRITLLGMKCIKVEAGTPYLHADLEEECWKGRHLHQVLFVMVPLLLVFVVGMPLYGLVLATRDVKRGDEYSRAYRYGAFFGALKTSRRWWQVWVAYWKCSLILCITFSETEYTAIQMVLLLLAIMMSSVILFSPYDTTLLSKNSRKLNKSYSLGQLMTVSMVGCFLSAWVGLFFMNSENQGEGPASILMTFILVYHGMFSIAGMLRNAYLIKVEKSTRRSDLMHLQLPRVRSVMMNPMKVQQTTPKKKQKQRGMHNNRTASDL